MFSTSFIFLKLTKCYVLLHLTLQSLKSSDLQLSAFQSRSQCPHHWPVKWWLGRQPWSCRSFAWEVAQVSVRNRWIWGKTQDIPYLGAVWSGNMKTGPAELWTGISAVVLNLLHAWLQLLQKHWSLTQLPSQLSRARIGHHLQTMVAVWGMIHLLFTLY